MAGKFTWGNKAKHCWMMSTNFFFQIVDNTQQCFAFTTQVNFPTNNLDFHWRWRWWDRIQAIFLNLFYFNRPSVDNRAILFDENGDIETPLPLYVPLGLLPYSASMAYLEPTHYNITMFHTCAHIVTKLLNIVTHLCSSNTF